MGELLWAASLVGLFLYVLVRIIKYDRGLSALEHQEPDPWIPTHLQSAAEKKAEFEDHLANYSPKAMTTEELLEYIQRQLETPEETKARHNALKEQNERLMKDRMNRPSMIISPPGSRMTQAQATLMKNRIIAGQEGQETIYFRDGMKVEPIRRGRGIGPEDDGTIYS